MIDHMDQLGEDSVVCRIKLLHFLSGNVPTPKREFQPNAGFLSFAFGITELACEVSRVAPFAPSFADVRTH
jgi:hypothetical protein